MRDAKKMHQIFVQMADVLVTAIDQPGERMQAEQLGIPPSRRDAISVLRDNSLAAVEAEDEKGKRSQERGGSPGDRLRRCPRSDARPGGMVLSTTA